MTRRQYRSLNTKLKMNKNNSEQTIKIKTVSHYRIVAHTLQACLWFLNQTPDNKIFHTKHCSKDT